MKKCIISFLLVLTLLGATVCSAANYGLNKSATVKGISVAVTSCKLSGVVGDRTKDNYSKKNGPYFALGSKIVKASDYNQITLSFKISNKTKKVYNFSRIGLKVKLPDGTDLSNFIDASSENEKQVSAGATENVLLKFYKENKVKANKLILTYDFLDYTDGLNSDIYSVALGKMTVPAFNKKYPSANINYEVPLK